ncbi:MAG: hypothetical protein GY724_03160 [Actinomycetia bacterium]|nr:hypothetical protein [Actinomycetes bacterium]MCP4226135.1 hypothetical protein [Actinomycetes bacterium]MCP5033006.1 hypothetical protein [Actinomycetes bacterium]
MSGTEVIGTSQAVIDDYERDAIRIFAGMRANMALLVEQAFALTYEGPDALEVFNPGLINLATSAVGQMEGGMSQFASAVGQVTSNISRSLGAGEIVFAYEAKGLELPPAPGIANDDFRIDVEGFERFITQILPDAQTEIRRAITDNQEAFNRIPMATLDSPGWSGQSRDHAQNVVVPRQTENLMSLWDRVGTQITEFMVSAKNGTLEADGAGAVG